MDVVSNNSMESNNEVTDGDSGCNEQIMNSFAALTSSMWPQNLEIAATEDESDDVDFSYDEFGFRVVDGQVRERYTIEDPAVRLKWLAHLEFTYSKNLEGELSWDDIEIVIHPSNKLKMMIHEFGIPHSLRPQLWMRMSGALVKRTNCKTSYKEIVNATTSDHIMCSKQIEKDLVRTLPSNVCFSQISSTGVPRLRRILRGLAWLYPDIGYCQGMGVIVAHLLLFLEEEDTFWLMCAIIEDLLPVSYYSTNLIGVQADQMTLRELIPKYLPKSHELLSEHDIEISLITLHWFLTIFGSIFNIRNLLRVWDLFFYEGSVVLFRIILGMIKLKESEMLQFDNTAQIFNCLSKLPSEITNINNLISISYEITEDLDFPTIQILRKKHLAQIMTNEGLFVDPNHNLPKQLINKRQLKRSRSLISQLLWHNNNSSVATSNDVESVKLKNIRQTEMLVDLRNAILQIIRHFENHNTSHSFSYNTQPDYSLHSHAEDLERYVQVTRNRQKRAKAILDFERHDDDELGFKKNDIINIISMKDEHCWVGELNGLRGWFPAKFVEILDERSKDYCPAGDDSVNEDITDLIRGQFCPALKAIFEHGMKRAHLLESKCHPWLFIEEAASREVEKDFHSVYSRLMLCKTFRLDEDGKVLTPEEILYKAIQSVNYTHDNAHAQMDVKLRSLVCCGLNDQVLHLWLETLCSSLDVVKKWYHPWSFIRSPGWVQIKCELRILSQFSFTFNKDIELQSRLTIYSKKNDNVQRNVRDMLVKHHLFSWEIN